MIDEQTWPDPERPGFPENPTEDGPHLLQTPDGWRIWAWWSYSGKSWTLPGQFGGAMTPELAGKDCIYLGSAVARDGKLVPLIRDNLSTYKHL